LSSSIPITISPSVNSSIISGPIQYPAAQPSPTPTLVPSGTQLALSDGASSSSTSSGTTTAAGSSTSQGVSNDGTGSASRNPRVFTITAKDGELTCTGCPPSAQKLLSR
jgi:hypothetical protein